MSSSTKYNKTNSDTLKTIGGVAATKDKVGTDSGVGVGPEDAASGRNNEAALHSNPSQASAWPSKPSPPDEDDEGETNKDQESDSDDDFPEFYGGYPRGKIVGPVTGGQSGRPIRPTRPK
ncbi:hypothetical protein K443DRAFT_679602 [Laccaria amethystina LaAM-08-1]|uniref:Uncharacterized protein n=1 Tax=Laccaria amethystina LaAM-08-1 TaxID=1095629 RepID=A0A0C9XQH9_9AGAR|nr:hypothetical protein K443DRAFT_679602 [Laccaria amethystina LaAM-08-1]